ncbi:hypothetical protein [Caballeronia sp. LZ034LL]|uniref:hypothetical protein n=1 Tax=Caballeronia sp. LZ034LL TaxID=3038567 RepID=UPI00285B6BB8|nr:hypothetical protein [Caballeronia sp. LZ034LL]MDR5839306.1 hypothetical protein [Caballeronia sp. LZ034LL]
MRVSNNSDVSLPLAVWLLHDEYDYQNDPDYISVTKLMRPLRHLVLPHRIPDAQRETPDVTDFIASALGKSLHDSIEKAWTKGYRKGLQMLGYTDDIIDHVRINPETPEEGTIPIYIEQRAKRKVTVNGRTYTIGGKFDMVMEGQVMDNKSTTAYTWVYGGKDEDYRLQGSLYRWLNPEKITEDTIRINFIFTDWQKMQAKTNPNYPQHRVMHKDVPLLSVEETEAWVIWKLTQVQKYWGMPENQIPECTDEELWRSDPKFKYYSDPTKTAGKSTKNFDTLLEANQYWKAEKGGKGIVITVPGEVKRCGYCDAYDACTQKDRYITTP